MDENTSLNRRKFVSAALTVATCGTLASCTNMGGVNPVFPTAKVDIGDIADYPREGIYDKWAKTHGFFVLRQKDRIVAITVVCTHRKCVVEKLHTELICPCHDSHFNEAGLVETGPASKPLPRFAIALNDRGRLIVDPARSLDEQQWLYVEAFVRLPGA